MEFFKLLFHAFIFPGGIFIICISLLISGIDRKLVARMQRRIGPPILQPFYDILKLIGKEVIIPKYSNKKIFLVMPIVGLVSVCIIPLLIPIFNNIYISFNGDIIFIIYLITISVIALIVCGINSSSTFGNIGASREAVLLLSLELPMVISIISVCIFSGEILGINNNFLMNSISLAQINQGSFMFTLKLLPAALAFLMIIPGEAGVIPFDIAEGETEICEGPLVEYSGRYLAILKLTQSIKGFIMSSLFVSLFLGGNISNYKVVNIIIFIILTCIVMFFSITVVRTVFGRLKINQALKFYWTIPTILSLISLILVSYF
ncbi:hydrogenase [Clostridium sardiniense]